MATSALCRECDGEAHPVIPGQRRIYCAACGYRSHWLVGRFNKELGLVVVNGGYQADWTDGEYPVSMWCERWKDGRVTRLTLCCFAPPAADVRSHHSTKEIA